MQLTMFNAPRCVSEPATPAAATSWRMRRGGPVTWPSSRSPTERVRMTAGCGLLTGAISSISHGSVDEPPPPAPPPPPALGFPQPAELPPEPEPWPLPPLPDILASHVYWRSTIVHTCLVC